MLRRAFFPGLYVNVVSVPSWNPTESRLILSSCWSTYMMNQNFGNRPYSHHGGGGGGHRGRGRGGRRGGYRQRGGYGGYGGQQQYDYNEPQPQWDYNYNQMLQQQQQLQQNFNQPNFYGNNRRGGGNFRQDRRDGSTDKGDGGARSAGRERPPPHLKGREIGMWFARKSQNRKEKEQINNRPSVSMDQNKERNIRRLLNNFKDDKGETGASPSTSSHPAQRPETAPVFKQPMAMGDSALKAENTQVKKEACDSWEELCSSDNDHDESFDSVNQEATAAPVEVKAEQDDALVDDEDLTVPSVRGVMDYMSSHSDYPYQVGADSDFQEAKAAQGNPALDAEMSQRMLALHSDPQFCKMKQFREKLPSYKMRKTVVDTVNSAQVIVISGETGCGKTTQVPQFILDDYIERGVGSSCSIICTQPRRISAISVAERVAAERCEKVDANAKGTVGYQIRLETKRPRMQGSILFCTTGIVLKFLEGDRTLQRATHVIIDEIHERDLQSDFLMIILKDLLQTRKDLKVILMSATLNANMFSQYFNNCPMLNIPGYTFPVKEYYLEQILDTMNFQGGIGGNRPPRRRHGRKKPEEIEWDENYAVWCRNQVGKYSHHVVQMLQQFDYSAINLDLVFHIIQHIHVYMDEGAILIFVPGWEEIKKLNTMIEQQMRSHSSKLRVLPLHSLMPTVNQREIFDRPPPGVRKIVIATNIAETSITIDDVVYVIDCGKIKVKGFDPENNLSSLEPQWVSKANAKQRRGRAGRVQAGHCFHLFTEFHHQMAEDYLPPEMLRTRLEELCLQIKLLKLGRIVPFISKAMQHPSMEAIQHAIQTLMDLNALDADENLLPLGYHLARMPVEPHTAKMILFAAMFGCLDPVLTVAASLSFKDAFVIPLGKEDLADEARKRLAMGTKSDHIMLVNAFQGWEDRLHSGANREYCFDNYLSDNTLKLLRDMKRQLAEILFDMGFIESKSPKDAKSNTNKGDRRMLRAIICAGLYPNVAQLVKVPRHRNTKNRVVKMTLKDTSKVVAHPKSVNNAEVFFESKWMVFYTKLKTSKIYIHDSTMVSPYPLLFFGGKIDISKDRSGEVVSVDNWMIFKCSRSTATLVKDLRAQLDEVLLRKITKPGPTNWNTNDREGAIMTAIKDLITTEQMGCGQQDDGSIGIPD